ncbi:biogenesis of lysosome-related organelles complex 1 subunit 3 [Hoplias malabaricus]|uniref:biogenesis of lysosome-related organelles complex 1 subunit 3 n=1 Tax=Hoplias malabaricus TaxID=27720 RepID=UPI003461BECC
MDASAVLVLGEAEETDSDSDLDSGQKRFFSVRTSSGLTVPGEASETDSEGEPEKWRAELMQTTGFLGFSEGSMCSYVPALLGSDVPALVVSHGSASSEGFLVPDADGDKVLKESGVQNTLLQQKLAESNSRFCSDLQHSFKFLFQNSTRDIRTSNQNLSSSQNSIISTSHSVRLILDDLRAVSDKIDIITSCSLLPHISVHTRTLPL